MAGATRALATREALHYPVLAQAGLPSQGPLSALDEELALRATLPGTAAITHMRDIVL